MKNAVEVVEERGLTICTRDSCNNIIDLVKKWMNEMKEKREKIITEDPDQGLVEEKESVILQAHHQVEVVAQVLIVLLPKRRKRRRKRNIRKRRKVLLKRKRGIIPVLAVKVITKKMPLTGEWIC